MNEQTGLMINGLINVRKEADYTSHDVVARLRGILRQKKIGHTGTLDPAATGVLPVCLGKATKVCSLIEDWVKGYETVLLLGVETDTEDMTGKILSEQKVEISDREIREIIAGFIGDYAQIPPMYSAKKVKGRKLYEMAREGITIEREPASVQIFSIEITEVCLPRVRMRVSCSKGTYIRSLCRDIGRAAGCGGCMESLVRFRVGRFGLEDALTLSEIEKASEEGRVEEILIPTDRVFDRMPAVTVKEKAEKLLYNGNPFPAADAEPAAGADESVRVYDRTGRFIGIYRPDEKNNRRILRPVRLFL